MAIEGLTQQQSDFVERFLKVPKVFNRKAKKAKRQEATEQFRLFNAEHDLLREEIAAIEDAELRSVFMAQLHAAEGIIESDPKALNFEGGQQQIDDVRAALLVHVRKADATNAHAQLEKAILGMDEDNVLAPHDGPADAQSDIALTWAFVQEKFASGTGTNNIKDLDAALKAMGRLQVMMSAAEKTGKNPFELRNDALAGVKEAAQEGLSEDVQAARRSLLDTFNQLEALREKLAGEFGAETVPLALRMGCQACQSKMDEAVKATTDQLASLAYLSEASYRDVKKDAEKLITQAQGWSKDHAAFQVRHKVMKVHPYGGESLVKPKFDEIAQAYSNACEKADGHDYVQACLLIGIARNNLKDALDFADDYASYAAVLDARKALLATLPDPADYAAGTSLVDDDTEARALLTKAEAARKAGQMSGALTLLNTIPKAVADLIETNRFATQFNEHEDWWKSWHDPAVNDNQADVLALLQTEVDYSLKTAAKAREIAATGNYRKASAMMSALSAFAKTSLYERAQLIESYMAEKEEFTTRRRAIRATKGAGGRVAIEAHYQALVGDEAKRKGAEANGDFLLAKAMCTRLKAQHDEMMGLAADAKMFLVEKTAYHAALAKLQTATSPDAMAAKENANDMWKNAFAATERGNWKAATNLLENANLELKRAIDDAETAALIDGNQNGAGKMELTSDTEFAPVYAAFAKILAHTQSLDKGGIFDDELLEADTNAKSVEALMAKDLTRAENTLNEAIATCQKTAMMCTAAAGFDAQRKTADAVIKQAEQVNAENVIDAEIKDAKDSFAAAEKAAAAPAHDFVGAIKLLATAQAKARTGMAAMQLYTGTIKDARTKMALAISKYNEAGVAAYLGGHATRINTVQDEMNADFDARKLTDAEAKAVKGVELASFHVDHCAECIKVADFMRNFEPAYAGVEAGHVTAVADEAEMKKLVASATDAMNKGSFEVAYKVGSQAYWVMMGARKRAEAFDQYLPVKLECETKLTDLELRSVAEAGPGHEAVTELRKTFDDAMVQDKLENYGGAEKRLSDFAKAAQEAADLLDVYDRYVLRKTQAQAALEKVRQMKSPAIETLLARLEGKDRNAERKGQGFDFAIAIALYEELNAECLAAKDTAEAVDKLASMTAEIKDLPSDDAVALKAAIAKARKALETCIGQPSSMYLHGEIEAARGRLKDAETQADAEFEAARLELEAVVDATLEIRLLMAQYDQLNDSAAVARGLADALLKRRPAVDFVQEDITKRIAALEVAMGAARQSKSNRSQTQSDVEVTITALRDLRKHVDAQEAYLKNRAPIKQALAALEQSKQRHLVREDMTAVRKLLDTAETHATERKHPSAEGELKKAVLRIDMAILRAKLANNRTPDADDLAAILDAPDGIDYLDSIIENLEASVQRDVMALAFEARFGCKLDLKEADENKAISQVAGDDLKLPAANIRRFYEEMSKLPASSTLDNDSLLVFEQVGGTPIGSEYNGGEKRVLMRDGNEAESRIYGIAIEHEIGEIDPDAMPKDGQARTGFSWNTLHEVGHAVDDKLGYMKKHGERLAGWKTYGADVKEPAGLIAGAFKFDADYVAEYMMGKAGRKMPMPDPVGCDLDEWHRRMEECRTFVDRARESNTPWSSASVAAACAIGNYTYVESYEGVWARYSTDQRKYAVSGYQFRAPGEWFSEMYAAVASDRVKDSHPHREEIAKLCLKEDA